MYAKTLTIKQYNGEVTVKLFHDGSMSIAVPVSQQLPLKATTVTYGFSKAQADGFAELFGVPVTAKPYTITTE